MLSGTLLFGVQLKVLKTTRETRTRKLKPYDKITTKTQNERAKNFAKRTRSAFEDLSNFFYDSENEPVLKSIIFNVQNKDTFQVDFGEIDKEENKLKRILTVKATDQGQISRNGYRTITTLSNDLIKEWAVSEEKALINKEMQEKIPISIVKLNSDCSTEPLEDTPTITDPEVIQIVQEAIGNGGQRSIIKILQYLIPPLIERKVLDPNNPIIHLRISGDGRNVGRQVKHVMVTCAIMNDKDCLKKPDAHYTTVLYPGVENYTTLQVALDPMLKELQYLKEHGIQDQTGITWNVELYFSSDWKFLALCLGLNCANSTYFCPWCTVTKHDQGDLSKDWKITTNMDNLKENATCYPGHIKQPLFDMIPIKNWVVDELHIMLRITDRLWALVIQEFKEMNKWNDYTRKLIIEEMKRIGVNFHFYEDRETKSWHHTSLMGPEKLKVLQKLDFNRFFRSSRAQQLRNLWNSFLELYELIQDFWTNPIEFKHKAVSWLQLFLTPSSGIPNTSNFIRGLYLPKDVTPYMHVLVYHVHEMMDIHRTFGIGSFSCSAVERKNHDHVLLFFRRTMKDGGKGSDRKSAILNILEFENRSLYFFKHTFQNTLPQSKKLRIN